MNKAFLVAALLFSGFSINLHGAPCIKSSHQYNQVFENKELETLSANGSVFLNNSTVSNSVSVNGALHVKQSIIGNLQTNGGVKIETSSINNETMINGALLAYQSTFKGALSVASERTVLNDCELNQVIIKQHGNSRPLQVLELSGNTTVRGDIIFEAQGGQVVVIGNVKLLGEVIGGDIQFIQP